MIQLHELILTGCFNVLSQQLKGIVFIIGIYRCEHARIEYGRCCALPAGLGWLGLLG